MAQKKPLEKLLGSAPRVRLLQFFLSSPGSDFTLSEVALRTKTNTKTAKLQLKSLVDIGILTEQKHAKKARKA